VMMLASPAAAAAADCHCISWNQRRRRLQHTYPYSAFLPSFAPGQRLHRPSSDQACHPPDIVYTSTTSMRRRDILIYVVFAT
jgi:hypothetical protein